MQSILSNPATAYIISFGGLGLLLALALNGAHKFFTLSERVWGGILLASGAVGGMLIQEVGLVTLTGASPLKSHLLSAFIGMGTAAAAAGFSAVDLRAMIKPSPKE